jgi:hypothetical protein
MEIPFYFMLLISENSKNIDRMRLKYKKRIVKIEFNINNFIALK